MKRRHILVWYLFPGIHAELFLVYYFRDELVSLFMVMANFILLIHSLLLCIIEPIASRIYYWSIRQLVDNYLRLHPMKVTINFYIIVLFKNNSCRGCHFGNAVLVYIVNCKNIKSSIYM